MKEIKLTQGQIALVDDEDFEFLNQWKWYAHKFKNTFYVGRNTPYVNGKRRTLKMHRVILGLIDPKILCDHEDRNGCNNQKRNLRIATKSQNNSNRQSKVNGTSKFLGVNWNSQLKKWHAQIRKDHKTRHLGFFDNELDAAVAYNKGAAKIHGTFANLNKVPCGI